MTVTLAQLESWKPESLTSAADQLNTDRKTLIDQQDEIYGASPPASWSGKAKTAATTAHQTLVDDLNDIAAAISPVIAALDAASSKIAKAKESAMSAKSTVTSKGWELTVSGANVTVDDPSPDEDADQAGDDQNQMRELAEQIAQAIADATAADQELTAVLQSATKNQYDGGSGSIEDAALPPELRDKYGSDLINAFLDDPDKYSSYADALSTYEQQQLGEGIADRWSDFNVEGAPLGEGDPYKNFDNDELAGLNKLLEAYGADSTISTALINKVGPDGVLQIQETLVGWPRDGGSPLDPNTIGDAQDAWGRALAAATNGTTDGASGSSEHVSDDFINQLLENGDHEYAYNDWGGTVMGYQLLGPLLGSEGHGSHFLNEVGTNMENFEQNYLEENEGYGSPWDKGDDDFQLDYRHGVAEPTENGIDRPTGHDPFGGLMEGLSHNPEAARDFFSTDSEAFDEDRIKHYMSERDWPSHEAIGSGWPDSQRYFGDALVTATTHDPTAVSADLAEQAVHYGSEDSRDGGLPGDMRRPLGEILGGYMPDVYDSLGGGEPTETGDADPFTPGVQNPDLQANFDDAELRGLLTDVGQDDEARHQIEGSAALYANQGYDAYYSGAMDDPGTDPNADNTWLNRHNAVETNVNSPYADIIGATREGGSEADRLAGFAADADANDDTSPYDVGGYVADQVVGELAGKVPFVGGALGDAGSAGIDAAVGGLNGPDQDTSAQVRQEIGDQIAGSNGGARAFAENAVYRNLPDSALSPVFNDADGHRIPMSEWGPEQRDAWAEARIGTGPAGTASQLSNDLVDQITGGQTQAEQEGGN